MDVNNIIEKLGGPSQAAQMFCCSPAAVSQWKAKGKIPMARLLHLQAARPDLFETQPDTADGAPAICTCQLPAR